MELQQQLEQFKPISLKEMDQVALINRIDTKYIFHAGLLEDVLLSLTKDYSILTIDGIRSHLYDTFYFDDANLNLYLNHHNQRGSRYKLRLRKYGSSEISFIEVKAKTNKGRTVKSRKKTQSFSKNLDPEQLSFFREVTKEAQGEWQCSTVIKFNRITLVSLDPPERMTLDLHLQFTDDNNDIKFDNIIVAEVKQGSKSPSAFIAEMKRRRIQPSSISKYCLGLTLLRPTLKQNLFKKQQLLINTIQNRA
jgi:VTC domain